MKHKGNVWAASSAIGLCLALAPGFAQAQSASEGTNEGASARAASEDEIVVTARKREEALFDVPASGTVLTGADLANLVVQDAVDLIRQIPAASQVVSGGEQFAEISLRGQGVGRVAGVSETTTGIYRNGIFVAGGAFGGNTFSRLDLFDIAQVEAFRGPQGALYGRNAVGGSVNIVTTRPTDQVEGRADLGYQGDIERASLSAIVNIPLVAGLLDARIGGYATKQTDGFVVDLNRGDVVDERVFEGVRAAFRLRPSPAWDVTLTLEAGESQTPSTGAAGFSPDSGDPSPYTRRNLTSIDEARISERSAFLELNRAFSGAELSIIANAKSREGRSLDGDLDHFLGIGALPQIDLRSDTLEDFTRWGVEARLASAGSGRLSWLIGADAQSSDSEQTAVTRILRNTFSPISAAGATVNSLRADRTFDSELFSYSLFGSVEAELVDNLTLALEGRWQRDEKTEDGINRLVTAAFPVASYSVEAEFERFTPVATLRYNLNDRHSLYLRYATGYRPGGFNNLFLFQGTSTPNRVYQEEFTQSYEIGWKSRGLFDGHLSFDVAAFYAETDDVQLVSRDPASSSTQRALINAGSSEIYGAEFSVRGYLDVGPGRLSGLLGLSTSDGEFGDGSRVIQSPTVTLDLSGARVPRTRDLIGNLNLVYSVPVNEWQLAFMASVQAESGGQENLAGSIGAVGGLSLEDWVQTDLRVTARRGQWRLSAYGKNVTDEQFRTQALSNLSALTFFNPGGGTGFVYFFNEPRTWGVELGLRF